ncbi:hypothetical protein ANN_12408 [Periplaneta americana]|uniref:Resolvase HTH domain-containing protein n=1 Tax=Periplaneta americana TaxID=6978 RepID=A0ABQ8TGF2_PERAM|nr:hypothetical protein ANN_12408 [Periplaneta americana]
MAGLCEGGNEPAGSLKAISREGPRPTSRLLASRPHAEAEVDDHPTRMEVSCGYHDDPPSRYSWHSQPDFATYRRNSLEDDVRTGRPQTIRTERKIQEVATLVRANRSQSVDDIAATVGVSHGTCYKILSDDLNMSRVTQHSVPRILSQDQRDDRMTICGDLISSADDDPTFLNRIITGDET